MVTYRVLPMFLASFLFTIVAIEPAATQTCSVDVTCANGTAAYGTYPECYCDGPPAPIEEPENPACTLNFGCPDASYVGVGIWPDCVCRGAKNTGGAGDGLGDPGSFDPGAGGAATCSQFFSCPPRFRMAVGDDGVGCLCKEQGGY